MWGALKRLLGIASGPDPARTGAPHCGCHRRAGVSKRQSREFWKRRSRCSSCAKIRKLRRASCARKSRGKKTGWRKRSETLDRKETDLDRREQRQRDREHSLQEREDELEELFEQERQRLEQLGQLSTAEGTRPPPRPCRRGSARRRRSPNAPNRREDQGRGRSARPPHPGRHDAAASPSEVTTESTVSVVPIPSDEMKGADHRP